MSMRIRALGAVAEAHARNLQGELTLQMSREQLRELRDECHAVGEKEIFQDLAGVYFFKGIQILVVELGH